MRDFRKLDVWHAAIEFSILIYEVTDNFPGDEKFGLTSQLRRASVSVPSNIAEGCSRKTAKDFSRFLEYSIGSLFEIETQSIIASKRSFMSNSDYQEILKQSNSLQKRTNALRSAILK